MHRRHMIPGVLLAIAACFAPWTADAGVGRGPAAAIHAGRLIHIDEAGHLRVWNLPDGGFDADLSAKLAGKSLTHLWSGGDRLWAASKSAVYSWTPEQQSWKKAVSFDAGRWPLLALSGAGGSPLLVFQHMEFDPIRRLAYERPLLNGTLFATLATDSMLWLGTGQGEWGGTLIGLNPRTGRRVSHGDALHYVTGITQAKAGELIVSWSMSHFGADTLIRVHRLDGTSLTDHPELGDRYYQSVAFNPHDGVLYGVENTDVVSITDGQPTKIAALEGPVFSGEPRAIGVAPGVEALLPVATKTLVVFPKQGLPWLLRDAELTRLVAP